MNRRRSLVAVLPVALVLTLAGTPSADAAAPGAQLRWQGQLWNVRTTDGTPMAGPGYFRAFNARVDAAGKLRLRVTRDAKGLLSGGEINSARQDWGYGRYRIVVEGAPKTWNPHHVFGFYVLGQNPTGDTYELDTEASQWGWPNPTKWEHVYHSKCRTCTAWAPAFYGVTPDQGHTKTLHDIVWQRGRITWDTYGLVPATATARERWSLLKRTVKTAGVPVPGTHRVGMNFWVFGGGTSDWRGTQTREVVVSSFLFVRA